MLALSGESQIRFSKSRVAFL
jgi:hypothetical protein